MKKILVLGPLENLTDPTNTGGTVVLFMDLIRELNKQAVDYAIIDTNKANYSHKLIALFSIWYQLLIKAKQFEHISLHGSANDYIFIAPFAVLVAKSFGKSISLRKFAGDFREVYNELNSILKSIVSLTLKYSDINFFETKYLVRYFSHFNKNTYYFPNVREKPTFKRFGPFQKRFIFIGSVTIEKGILELLQASNNFDNTYTIHMYGTIAEDLLEINFSQFKAKYIKSLHPTDVLQTMSQYDVLILPSYYEGYPGVVIEALSLGLPVIVTNLEGIQEMVDESCAVFITPKNVEELQNAITYFNKNNYDLYSKNALNFFERFDSNIQTRQFLKIIFH